MRDLLERGFILVAEFRLCPKGKIWLDYSSSIDSTSGVLAISDQRKVKYITATRNYGPRIQTILYSNTGPAANTDRRLNENIRKFLLSETGGLGLWKKDELNPHPAKNMLNAVLNPEWSRQ